MNTKRWYWLAINGASCAASYFPMMVKELHVKPVPEVVIGYGSQERQLNRQEFFLTQPLDALQQYVKYKLQMEIATGEAVFKRLPNPEPPTTGPTLWGPQPIPEIGMD